MFSDNENAVSPVVGVMLMLIITIVIAAVVSGFAGGLADSTSKSPQVSIQADYSQSTGMTISHMGGDVISTINTKIYVAPTSDFGNYDQLRWEVNTSVVMISRDNVEIPWFDPALSSSDIARTFQPGETAFISVDNLAEVQPKTYTTSESDSESSYYGFLNSNARGQRFVLSLVDDSTGRTIASTEVPIDP